MSRDKQMIDRVLALLSDVAPPVWIDQRYERGLRCPLKAAGFLTRDSRVVQNKKYGKRKARRSFQLSNR